MSIRYQHSKCQRLGLKVIEAKCLRYVGQFHPKPTDARHVFGQVPEQLKDNGLIQNQQTDRPDSNWRLTRKGAMTFRKLTTLHTT